MNQLRTKFIPVLALLAFGAMQAQTPFWSEDFSAGIPATWTNADGGGHNVLWTWCTDPEDGGTTSGCPGIFTGQLPFRSNTASTGFVTLDSDQAGQLSSNHVSRLTTPAIDCSGKSKVFVAFVSQIGVYATSAVTGAVLRVSTDKVNWKSYTIYPDVDASNKYWSNNFVVSGIEITDKAANQSTVYLQWQWTGNYEYVWNLDDIGVYDSDPTAANDLTVGDFFYGLSSAVQPASQVATDTVGFSVDVSNRGTADQTNVVVKVEVATDTGEGIFADSTVIPVLAAGVIDTTIELPNRYAPELPSGDYQIRYTVRSDAPDQYGFNNEDGDPFYVRDNTFSKENVGYGYTATQPADQGDWAVANLYRMGTGSQEKYMATTAQFAYAADDPSTVQTAIYLLRVRDDVSPDLSDFDQSELLSSSVDIVGYGNFSGTSTSSNYQIQTVDLLDFISQEKGVALDNGAQYFLAVQYSGASNTAYQVFNLDTKMFFVSTAIISPTWFLGGFGEEYNAVPRMDISLATTTDNKPLPESAFRILPNPVRETLNLGVQFAHPTDVTVTIANIDGRVIQIEDRKGLTSEKLSYPVAKLAAGTYLARIATPEGTLTKKFVVQK